MTKSTAIHVLFAKSTEIDGRYVAVIHNNKQYGGIRGHVLFGSTEAERKAWLDFWIESNGHHAHAHRFKFIEMTPKEPTDVDRPED